MEYTIAAHPTKYADVEFRSRLEARWAAFFDLVGWSWEYEPVDLRGWTPDFSVTVPGLDFQGMQDYSQFWAEVKPYRQKPEWKGHPVTLGHPLLHGDCQCCWPRSAESCGCLFMPSWGCMALGLNPSVSNLSLHYHKYNEYVGSLAGIQECFLDSGRRSDFSDELLRATRNSSRDDMDVAWVMAGYRVQWKPKR